MYSNDDEFKFLPMAIGFHGMKIDSHKECRLFTYSLYENDRKKNSIWM